MSLRLGLNANVNADEARFIFCPNRNKNTLESENSELRDIKEAIEKQILELQGEPSKDLKGDVRKWVKEVERVDEEVSKLLNKRFYWWSIIGLFFCCVCRNCSTGKAVSDKLERIRQLKNQHHNWNGQIHIDIRPIESPVVSMRKEMQRLSDLEGNLEKKIRVLKMEQLVDTSPPVLTWMNEVDEFLAEIEGDIEEMERISRTRGRICELNKQYEDLEKLGLVVVVEPERVEDILWHSPPPLVVGAVNKMVATILVFLQGDEEGQLLGIYGAGGIGKSCLVWELNRSLQENPSLDLVICLQVNKDATIFGIQEGIGRRLGYSPSGEAGPSRAGPHLPADESIRAKLLTRCISEKKCLLILDDVPESIDLRRIGVSRESGNMMCKVVLTTREERVCKDMGVNQKLQMISLNKEDSWTLFSEALQRNDLLEQEAIRSRAERVVSMCGGIPRVILTVARAMSTKESALEWEVAAGVVNALAAEIGDSGDDLSSRLSGEIARRLEEAARALRAAEAAEEARWAAEAAEEARRAELEAAEEARRAAKAAEEARRAEEAAKEARRAEEAAEETRRAKEAAEEARRAEEAAEEARRVEEAAEEALTAAQAAEEALREAEAAEEALRALLHGCDDMLEQEAIRSSAEIPRVIESVSRAMSRVMSVVNASSASCSTPPRWAISWSSTVSTLIGTAICSTYSWIHHLSSRFSEISIHLLAEREENEYTVQVVLNSIMGGLVLTMDPYSSKRILITVPALLTSLYFFRVNLLRLKSSL